MKPGIRGAGLRIIVSLAALAVVFFSIRGKFFESLAILRSEVIFNWFALGLLTYLTAQIVLALRFFNILQVHEIRMKFGEVFYLVFVGLFFNVLFPSAVGGDVAKGYLVYKRSGKKLESTTSVIADRLMGFIALMSMAVGGILLFRDQIADHSIQYIVYLGVAILILALLFLGNKGFARSFKSLSVLIPSFHWRQKLSTLYHSLHAYRHHLKAVAFGIFLSFIGQAFFILVYYWMTLSLGVQLSPQIFFVLVPVITLASMAPSFGGLGVREAGLMFAFQRFLTSERAFALSLLVDCAIYGCSLIAGLIFCLRGGLKSKMIHEMEVLE